MRQQTLSQRVADALLPHPPDTLGVAVSGGGDSIALLHLLHHFGTLHRIRLHVVTVDHHLRPESAAEAEMVAEVCAGLGLRHDVLHWEGWDGNGNLQDAARRARYALMAEWARGYGIDIIAVGHTADDQAETLLMRLARRSGVDGLAGMKQRLVMEGTSWVRPVLRASRAELRAYLQQNNLKWVEDPSNDNDAFERIKARKVLEALAPLGITVDTLTEVADNMRAARTALEWNAFLSARDVVKTSGGAVIMNDQQLTLLPDEIQRRIYVRALNWISGEEYPARRQAVSGIMKGLRRGQAGTAEGCHARRIGNAIWVFREFNAVADLRCTCGSLWDGRWRVSPRDPAADVSGVFVRALGEDGLARCPNWRESGLPHPVLLSTPSVWRDDELLAAPLAGENKNWHAELERREEIFFAALLTH